MPRIPSCEQFLPQWSVLIRDLVGGIREVLSADAAAHSCHISAEGGGAEGGGAAGAPIGGSPTCDFDVVAHSYGTAVANRLLRELCLEHRHPPAVPAEALRVVHLELIDPIVLGGASTGLVGVINRAQPDISFGFAANRAGVTTREVCVLPISFAPLSLLPLALVVPLSVLPLA